MKRFILGVFAFALLATPAWALFETNKDLIAQTKVPLEEAIRNAIKTVPGKAAEADLGKDEGRPVWKIKVIDLNNKSQTVYVDAQSGMTKLDK